MDFRILDASRYGAPTRRRRLFLVARAPEFFRRNGFVTVPRQDAPNFFECLTCPQYAVSCHPEVMRIDLPRA